MEFAVVEGDPRRKAQPGQRAECPGCGQAMIARCGKVRIWHWAHERAGNCDFEWESETEWHRAWKNQFPEDWQERICSTDGKKHFADVMTASGMVLEFQHSPLEREQREARESFYPKMVWVADGLTRKRDRVHFFKSVDVAVKLKPLTFSVLSYAGALLRDWAASRKPVFFDFGNSVLWRLSPRRALVSPVMKSDFLNAYVKSLPLKGIDESVGVVQIPATTHFLKYIASKPRFRF